MSRGHDHPTLERRCTELEFAYLDVLDEGRVGLTNQDAASVVRVLDALNDLVGEAKAQDRQGLAQCYGAAVTALARAMVDRAPGGTGPPET